MKNKTHGVPEKSKVIKGIEEISLRQKESRKMKVKRIEICKTRKR